MNKLRECTYKDEKCLFHGFFQRAYTHESALTIGGFPAGQESETVAIIELPSGEIKEVSATKIKFIGEEQEETL